MATHVSGDFTGHTALITGAASGIGAACARWLDAAGIAKLVLVDTDGDGLAALELSCTTELVAGDVGDPTLWNGTDLGALDHAIVNAGVAAGGNPIAETDFAEWRRVLEVNLDGAFLTLRAAMRAMRDGGSVVVTASAAAIKTEPGTAAYSASKAGAIQLAKVAAKDGAARGIRVNAIAPGGIDTPIWDKQAFLAPAVEAMGSRAAVLDAMAKQTVPFGRFQTADEIAAQIGFLLSDAAGAITGAVLVSDGGYSL